MILNWVSKKVNNRVILFATLFSNEVYKNGEGFG